MTQREILAALEKEARLIGYAEVSRRAGMPRTHLYRLFSKDYGNPSLESLIRIAKAVGLRLEVK